MQKYIDFQLKDGTLRLEAVLPGAIRCVQTLNAPVAEPSELIVPQEEQDFPVELLPDGIVSGGLKAVYDAKKDRIAWFKPWTVSATSSRISSRWRTAWPAAPSCALN